MPKQEVTSIDQVENAIALVNPNCTNYSQGLKRLHRLQEHANFSIDVNYTSANPTINRAIIEISLESCDLLLAVTGDGTLNHIVNTQLSADLSPGAKQTPIWSLGGGDANDGHKAKHDSLYRRRPELALKDGRIVEIYPIKCAIETNEGEHYQHYAAFYQSLGATALASNQDYLNNPKHRNSFFGRNLLGQLLSEPVIAAKALYKAQTPLIQTEDSISPIYDLVIANSSRMAKRCRYPTTITRRELFKTTATDKNAFTIFREGVRLVKGMSDGVFLNPEDSIDFIALDPLWSQYDGEAKLILPGSKVSIGISPQPVHMVVTNPDL